nr:negative cofactor 2 complex subunit beta [Quercus suber]
MIHTIEPTDLHIGNDDLSLPKGMYISESSSASRYPLQHGRALPKMDDIFQDLAKAPANRLTKATVQKIITEVLQQTTTKNTSSESTSSGFNFAKETRDLLIECCVEFITMLSSEANEIAERDAKKTIACEHITKALDDLGFGEYVPELLKVADSFKSSQASREKKQNKVEQSGLSSEELIKAQEALFRSATEKFNATEPGDG